MELIFLKVLIIFDVSISSFTKSNCREFIANAWVPNSPDLNALDYQMGGAILESYYKLQPKPQTVPEFKKMHFSSLDLHYREKRHRTATS